MPMIGKAHVPRTIIPGQNAIKQTLTEGNMTIELDCDIPLKNGIDVLRCNVFRPTSTNTKPLPVIMTAGPYGKDIKYKDFYLNSYNELPEEQKSKWSAWEVPEPTFWTNHGYCVVRVDEQGTGHSPGFMDTMSDQTSSNFAEAIEWAASQTWSNGKVGLLGISYFAGSQWRVAARQPKGLAAIIPWEGMSDYYRDRVRHGGILSNTFIDLWQNRHVNSNQYGIPPNDGSNSLAHMPGNSKRPANPEGTLTPEQLCSNRTDQTIDTAKNKYLDDPYFASRDYNLEDIQVPTLSVPNWGGISLHLRGNVMGYLGAGTKNKWMHFITGRHDLPFYLPEFVKLQKSFLDAFLKDQDDANWKAGPNAPGGVAAVTYTVRKGNPGFNKTDYERTFSTKQASAWPIPGTKYVDYHLTSNKELSTTLDNTAAAQDFKWKALDGQSVSFSTEPFTQEMEITGHVTLHVTVSVEGPAKDLDLFVTLRHFDSSDKEVYYTGTAGDPVPLTKGWQRLSLRKLVPESEPWLPRRNYSSSDVLPVNAGERYNVPVELWPTNVVVSKGGRLVVEIGPQDQQGTGIFSHKHPQDRSKDVFGGSNVLHVGKGSDSRLVLPFV